MGKRILVLHSGGMDSTVCLYLAASEEQNDVVSLGIDYGQALKIEMMFAAAQAAQKRVERKIIQVRWDKPERIIPLGRKVEQIKMERSPAYLPGRNLVFLALASAEGAGLDADEIHIGINQVDFSGYPDCTEKFIEAFRNVHAIGGSRSEIVAPLLHKSKPEIAKLASNLGIGEHDTWSCYRPRIYDGSIQPCKECDACKLHEFAWRKSEAG